MAAPFAEKVEIVLVIFIYEECVLLAISSLSDVMGQIRNNNTGYTSHKNLQV
jgi:hypothetical protein